MTDQAGRPRRFFVNDTGSSRRPVDLAIAVLGGLVTVLSMLAVSESPDALDATVREVAEDLPSWVASIFDAVYAFGALYAVAAAVEAFGSLDCAFNNAGVAPYQLNAAGVLAADLEEASWLGLIDVNLHGVWRCLRHEVAQMRRQGGGAIVNTASILGLIGSGGSAAYVASKHAVVGLTKAAAVDHAPENIRVNAVGPGPIDNRMIDSLQNQLAPDDPAALRSGIEASIAMRRYGTNEEVAHLIAFLASDASSYCNGAIHLIDGGYVAA